MTGQGLQNPNLIVPVGTQAVTQVATLEEGNVAKYEGEFRRLYTLLEWVGDESALPESVTARPALNDLLVRARLALGAGDTPSVSALE